VREHRRYDAESRLVGRERRSVIGSVGQLLVDSLTYSTRGLVRDVVTDSRTYAGPETIHTFYNPPGAVVAQERLRGANAYLEEFRTDAYGNVFQALTRGDGVTANDAPFLSTYSPEGALMTRVSVPSDPAGPFQQVVTQDQTVTASAIGLQSILTEQPTTGTPGPAVQVATHPMQPAEWR
jgi:hypothetical protein